MKNPDVYQTATVELSGIDSELTEIEQKREALLKRRESLVVFVELGRKLYGTNEGPPQPHQPSLALRLARTPPATTMKARIIKEARELVRLLGPIHTRELVPMIENAGVEITGTDKVVTVSVILSRSPEFVGDRSKGWSLAEKNPQDAPTSAGSSPA